MSAALIPIWFDIDGTLLHTRVGHGAFQNALRDIYGWEARLESVVFAGNTDLQLLMDLSGLHVGDPQAGLAKRHHFFARMAEYLDEGLRARRPDPVPGAVELVRVLVAEPQVMLGLITGNTRDCAFIKLRHVDLDMHFGGGGFGDDHADRNHLAGLARQYLQAQSEVDLAPGWVIGDTPRDVKAAQHIGARCLGVASGSFSETELCAAGAMQVVTDLTPTPDLLALLLG